MYKALITDLDGTAIPLASNGDEIDKPTQDAVAKAIAKGYKIACATGRDWQYAQPVVQLLGLVSPCIIEGGTRIVHAHSGKSIWEKTFETGVAAELLALLKVAAGTGKLMSSSFDSFLPLESISEIPDDSRYLYLLGISEDLASTIAARITTEHLAIAHVTPSWFGDDLVDIHLTHSGATKEHAMKVWQEIEGIATSEIIGMGDSGNDMPIFNASGLKVAVGNATNEIKEVADYIAPDVESHALAHVINKFLLSGSSR
jgi:HAD superfamily hydrolase (TIGR01484 family)